MRIFLLSIDTTDVSLQHSGERIAVASSAVPTEGLLEDSNLRVFLDLALLPP